jgi:hypothetical protein
MRTYVFLDFDGVLRTNSCPKRELTRSNLIAFSKDVLDIEDAKIVISSTWRDAYSLNELKTHLGEEIGALIVGVTPNAPYGITFERQRECYAWLKCNAERPCLYLAVDDNPEFFHDMPRVITNPAIGYQSGQLLDDVRGTMKSFE